jgi:gamma-resorcylate decarboxylase
VGLRCRNSRTHTLRLILSGLFDRFPHLKVILGHQGEGLPSSCRASSLGSGMPAKKMRGRQLKPVTSYLRENFYLTTASLPDSGAHRHPSRSGLGSYLFSVDYPYETVQEQSDWFESLPISEGDRLKIGRANAQQLLPLGS